MKIDVVTVEGSSKGITTLDIENGVGGAELALVTWAEVMAKRGHEITIYNNPRREGNFNNVIYRNDQWFNPEYHGRDAVITFRGPNKRVYRHKDTRKYIGWSCDQMTHGDYITWYEDMDMMVLISEFHKQDHYLRYSLKDNLMDKIRVLDLGVRTWEYDGLVEKKKQVIYCSIPDRGLTLLLDMWPEIQKILPGYELVITSDYRLWGTPDAQNAQYRLRAVGMNGIRFLGKVTRSELVQLQMESELQLYPCIYPENFCLHPESVLFLKDGNRKISDINVGDYVYDGLGKYSLVLNKTITVKTDTMYEIKTQGNSVPLRVTKDHKVLCAGGDDVVRHDRYGETIYPNFVIDWKCASELRIGDYLLYPIPEFSENEDVYIDLLKTIDDSRYSELDGKILQTYNHIGGKARRKTKFSVIEKVDEDFAKLIGFYIAEGSTGNGFLQFSFCDDEIDTHCKFVIDTMKSKFGLDGKIYRRAKHGIQIIFISTPLALFFQKLCGKGAKNKHIPIELLYSNKTIRESVFMGCFYGDGYINKNQGALTYTSKSLLLCKQIRDILLEMGITGTLRHNEDKDTWIVISNGDQLADISEKYNFGFEYSRKSCKRLFIKDGYLFQPITEIDFYEYSGAVYDIEIDNPEHSFVADGRVVHNCIATAECQVAGAIPITSNTGALETTNFTGFLLKTTVNNPNFKKDYLDALRLYVESPEDEKRLLLESGMRDSRERFDWNKICEKWERLISE